MPDVEAVKADMLQQVDRLKKNLAKLRGGEATPSALYHQYPMFSPYDMDQKRARKGMTLLQAWHAGGVSAPPEQGEACKLA